MRRIIHAPKESDFASKKAITDLQKVREAQNVELLALAMGHTDLIPEYQYTSIPGLPNPPVYEDSEKATADFERTVKSAAVSMRGSHDRTRYKLQEERTLIVPEQAIALEFTPTLKPAVEKNVSIIQAAAERGECLFYLPELRTQAAIAEYLRDIGLTVAEVLEQQAV